MLVGSQPLLLAVGGLLPLSVDFFRNFRLVDSGLRALLHRARVRQRLPLLALHLGREGVRRGHSHLGLGLVGQPVGCLWLYPVPWEGTHGLRGDLIRFRLLLLGRLDLVGVEAVQLILDDVRSRGHLAYLAPPIDRLLID